MADDKTSVWKKEIHLFGRRDKGAKAPKVARPEPVQALGEAAELTIEPVVAEKTSIWKKELSFGRKARAPKPPKAEKPPKPPKQPKLKAPKPPKAEKPKQEKAPKAPGDVPFWKKEISFRRKAKQVAPEPVAADPVVEEPVVAAEPVVLRPVAVVEPEPVAEAAPLAEPEPEPEPEMHPRSVAVEPDLQPVVPAVVERPKIIELPPVREDLEEQETFDLDEPVGDEPSELPPAAALAVAPDPEPEPDVEPDAAPAPVLFAQVPSPALSLPAPVASASSPEQRGPFVLPAAATESATEVVAQSDQPTVVGARVSDAAAESQRTRRFGLLRRGPKQKKETTEKLTRSERKARRLAVKEARKKLPGGAKKHKVKKIVGLKIGASQIAAARVSNNGALELLHAAREPLESGIVVAGELRDPEALATALKNFFKKHKLPKRGIRLGLSNNRIGVRLFEIAGMHDPEQLRNAIRFRAQETLPIPLDEAVLDYHVVGESVDEEGNRSQKVLLVVAYRDLIDRYIAACRKAGLRLIGIDLEAFALLRALGKSPGDTDLEQRVGLVVVSIGHDRSTFAVSDGVVCEFTRVLDWGGYSLNVGIARALDLTPPETEPIKLGLSLADPSIVPHGLSNEQAEAAREAVSRSVEGFARDLVSSLRFYQSQPDSLGIREIVLTGGTADMPGLAAELERLIGVYVRLGDPFGRVKVSRKVKNRDRAGSLAAAIGLGIED